MEPVETEDDYEKEIHTTRSRKRCLSKKRLFLVALLVILALLVTVIVLAQRLQARNSLAPENSVCNSASCVIIASRLLTSMNTSVDPCEDFFLYACGAWIEKHPIAPEDSVINRFDLLRTELSDQLLEILQGGGDHGYEPLRNARHYYESCMNITAAEIRGLEPALRLLSEYGGWPVLDPSWTPPSNFRWEQYAGKLRLSGLSVFMDVMVSSDDTNSSVNILAMDQPGLGHQHRNFYLKGRNDTKLLAYQNLAINVARLMGADQETAVRDMMAVVDLEIQLANITIPQEKRRDTMSMYHKTTLLGLYNNISKEVNWKGYFDALFNNVSLSVEMKDEIVLYSYTYMEDLVILLPTVSDRTLVNFMIWRLIQRKLRNLPSKFREEVIKYKKIMYGVSGTSLPNARFCVESTNARFSLTLGHFYVKKHFLEQTKSSALTMIHNIQYAFDELLHENDWMDDETRRVASEKNAAIDDNIGYPDYMLDLNWLEKYYDGYDMSKYNFFENELVIDLRRTQRFLKLLHQPVDKSKWSSLPTVVNAFYSPTQNRIMFPAPILQAPFFDAAGPKSTQYGGIGTVIGHEITHGFDDRGRQYDKDGNLKEWWSKEVTAKFKDKAECIRQQYGNITVPEIGQQLNGVHTLGENIADNGGLKQAFRAYRRWCEKNGEEEKLPAIPLDNNQLFFLNFAQIWCGNARKESLEESVATGKHSPNKYRVIGTLSNSLEFARAFRCPAGSAMNPVHKCSVW